MIISQNTSKIFNNNTEVTFELIVMTETMNTDEFTKHLAWSQAFLRPQALRLTRDEEAAKDLLQDTLLKAVCNCEKFEARDDTSLESWLFVIMKNTFLTQCRKQKRRRLVMGQLESGGSQLMASGVANNEGYRLFAQEDIERAMTTVKSSYRTAFTLYCQGYKYEEIADILSLPLGTIKSHIFEARKALKLQLAHFSDKSVLPAA